MPKRQGLSCKKNRQRKWPTRQYIYAVGEEAHNAKCKLEWTDLTNRTKRIKHYKESVKLGFPCEFAAPHRSRLAAKLTEHREESDRVRTSLEAAMESGKSYLDALKAFKGASALKKDPIKPKRPAEAPVQRLTARQRGELPGNISPPPETTSPPPS